MTDTFPSSARIVVVGGGVIGTSIAYHLAKSGETDVLLLEKTRLTEGATWHAAGLVGQFRSQQNLMSLMNDSVRLFDSLPADTDQEIGWRKVGSLRVAASADRWQELLRSDSAARSVGFDMEMLTPAEAKELYPLLHSGDLIGAAFIPEDGYVDPNSLTRAYAKGTRKHGGRVIEQVMVSDLIRRGNRISHVVTDHGTIEAEIVVNAAGLWARQLGWMAGVALPAAVVQHQYFVTEKFNDIPDGMPALRDPDGRFYAKPEPGALTIGGWERSTDPVNPQNGFPWENARHLFDTNMDRMEEVFLSSSHRLPLLNDLGVRSVVNGPIPISPDGEPVMGPVPGLENYFVACAFTSGVAASGGVGKAAANWLLEGDPGLDLWAFDVRRFGSFQSEQRFLHDRAVESYTKYYDIHWPGEEMESARGLRRSPLYSRLMEDGAVMGSKFGWERANWFEPERVEQDLRLGWDRPGQAETVGREHRAAREAAVIVDMTSFTKFEISGTAACEYLQYLAVANIDKPIGSGAYTQFCNARGGIEADVTIIRRNGELFWLITGSALGVRDRSWLEHGLQVFAERSGAKPDVMIRDITSAYGVLNLQGPKARQILQKTCNGDLSPDGLPFMSARDIHIGNAPALAYRITYVGELGWELYIPMEYLEYAYRMLTDAGAPEGMIDMGYHAIDSLRMEKRYLAWGVDINSDYTPLEAGLGFLIDWKKGDFIGREALLRQKETGVRQKLAALLLNENLTVFGGEAVLDEETVIAQTTSGNFAYSLDCPIAFAYLPSELAKTGTELTIQSFGETCGVQVVMGSPFDPQRRKILC